VLVIRGYRPRRHHWCGVQAPGPALPRPIRWDLVAQQYAQMVSTADGTGPDTRRTQAPTYAAPGGHISSHTPTDQLEKRRIVAAVGGR